jgi:hypothetical protein
LSTVRRAFFYILTLITLCILAAGLVNLLSLSLDTITASFKLAKIGDIKQQLSLGIAMLVIGGPLWYLFWSIIQRHVSGSARETGSAMRAFFLNFVLIVSAFVTTFTLNMLLRWMLDGFRPDQFSPEITASLIVFAAIWYYHWRISGGEGQISAAAKTFHRWYVYILSASGLVWLAIGLVQIVNSAFVSLPIWENDIVRNSFWNSGARNNLSWILVGGLVWALHWFYMARGDIKSSLRQVYFYLFTILGGAVSGLVAITATIYKILYWLLGGGKDIAGYFQFLGWSIPIMLIAAFIWLYHIRIAEEEAASEQEHQLSAKRVHYYLMSFIGLGTLVAGLIIMLGIPLDWLVNSFKAAGVVVEPEWWTNQLSLCISMVAVSVPIWLYYWSRVIDMADTGGIIEWRARSRRIYLYVIIGASVIMLAADLVNIIYQVLNGLLTGSFGVEALRNAKWSLQTVFIAIPVLVYHLRIARLDQRLGAETAAVHKNVTILLSDNKSPVVSLLEEKLGYKVRVIQYAGQSAYSVPQLSDQQVDQIASGIRTSTASNIMLVLIEGNIMVLPYEEG